MKIIRHKEFYRVLYMFEDYDDVYIDGEGLTGKVQATEINSDMYEIVHNVSAPDFWVPGALSYNAAWSMYDQSLFDDYVLRIIQIEANNKKEQVDAQRHERFYSSVLVDFAEGSGSIQFRDEFDRSNLANIATAALSYMMFNPAAEMVYRTEDNFTHTVTASGMAAIAMAVLAQKQTVVSSAWAHKDTINYMVTASGIPLLTTLSGILNYDTTVGWPE